MPLLLTCVKVSNFVYCVPYDNYISVRSCNSVDTTPAPAPVRKIILFLAPALSLYLIQYIVQYSNIYT
jgi:hypothetical protein